MSTQSETQINGNQQIGKDLWSTITGALKAWAYDMDFKTYVRVDHGNVAHMRSILDANGHKDVSVSVR